MNNVKLSKLRERLSHLRAEEAVEHQDAGDFQMF